ncbi:LemA family protein [Rubricoccus marinus]|uniref:LemA family protein n=1 Tax=Rubricoccus marinus TaxID=716817 RepID=A0A259TXH8_9BACT|nr:LemA family protein [Rubricoccus marinus]OZC02475.1 hypothetical protein BSZ36_05470 [Rubricoccus marinus]
MTYALIAFALVLAVGVALLYNKLVRLRRAVENAFAQIDVQLQRRHDLIPNLVETAKAYLAHEQATFEGVARARSQAQIARSEASPTDAPSMRALAQAESGLGAALGRLMAVSEAHPTLQADAQMAALHEELASTENRIAFSRQAYNDSVTRYDVSVESVPGVFVAGPLGFKPAESLLEAPPEAAVAPRVAFA